MPSSKLPSLLQATFQPPDTLSDQDADLYHRPWGFAIYRTSYEPVEASDMQWGTLLAKIKAQVPAEIDLYQQPGEEQVAARLKDLFFLDQSSDPALLGGQSTAEVRQVHMRRTGMESKGGIQPTWPGPRLFLLADVEVLEGVSRDPFFWVKCVDAEHDEETDKSLARNSRAPSSAVDGWFRMTTRSIVDLCEELRHCDWGNLPPQVQRWEDVFVYNGELTGSNLASAMSSGR